MAFQGLSALSTLSAISLPILIATMGVALFLADQREESSQFELLSWGSISIAIGAGITAVIDMPTYFRYARSVKEGLLAVVVLFMITVPLIEGVGIYLSYHNPAATITATLMKPNHFLWNLWVLSFMILAGWTTNNTNLYSAAVCLGSIWKNAGEKLSLSLVALIGTVLALAHVLDHLTLFLQALAIFVGSMGAVILTNFLSGGKTFILISLIAWSLGVMMGLSNIFQLAVLTPIAVLDAFLIASIFAFLGTFYERVNSPRVG